MSGSILLIKLLLWNKQLTIFRMPPKKATKSKKVVTPQQDVENMEVDKENVGDDVHYKDEGYLLHSSAADRYFCNGKTVTMNTITKGMRRLRVKAPIDIDTDDEDPGTTTGSDVVCDFAAFREYSEIKRKEKKKTVSIPVEMERKIRVYLRNGYNILVTGIGSKIKYLETIRDSFFKNSNTLTVNGFAEEATIRNILLNINAGLNLQVEANSRTSVSKWAEKIVQSLRRQKEPLYIFFNNIDGTSIRDTEDQDALRILVESERVKLLATVDNWNSTLLWHTRQASSFKWFNLLVDTYDISVDEFSAGKSRILGLDNKSNQTAHSVSSLDVFWQSISDNSKKIMHLFFVLTFDPSSGKEQSVDFWDLFQESKDRFLVSTDTALRQQLTEFDDHRILRRSRSADGNELLNTLVDRALIVRFFEEKNMPMDVN